VDYWVRETTNTTVRILILVLLFSFVAAAHGSSDFKLLFIGSGDINSFIYSKQNDKFFIDTDVNVSVDAFRYGNVYFNIHLLKETSMGRKYDSDMIFDPNRADYSFGLAGRLELERYFFELFFHHDSFHDIDRWQDSSIYWNSPRLGFGAKNYLPKYRYHHPSAEGAPLRWEGKLDYYALASFFAPRGYVWQKNHDYDLTLQTNFRYRLARYRCVGTDIESNTLWVVNHRGQLQSLHNLIFNVTLYGDHGAMMFYMGWWPHDNQSIRNRDGRTAFGVHLGF